MTELFIDGYRVTVGNEFRITLLQENPIFTKNGESTYDIDLDLADPVNDRVYRHCHRVNSNSQILPNRRAVLVVDSRVVLDGTEIILEITDKKVSIQLVSGESELNYLIGGDRKINELDLGDGEYDYWSDSGGRTPGWTPGPGFKNKYHFAPLYSINHDVEMNFRDFHLYAEQNNEIKPSMTGLLVRQPYFYHIVNLIIEALGYEVRSNCLAEDAWQYLYIVNGRLTSRYNRMLPSWTVNDFLSEVEKLFNLVLVVERDTKGVYLIHRGSYYEDAGKIQVYDVLDEYSNILDNESRESYSKGNVGYEVTEDDEYFKYQNISPLLLDFCEFKTLGNWSAINQDIQSEKKKNVIYTNAESGVQYIAATEVAENTVTYYPKKVNTFRPIRNNPGSPDLDFSFKITPAAMRERDVFVWRYEGYEERGGALVRRTKLYRGAVQMPAITTDEYASPNGGRSSAEAGDGIYNTSDSINDIQEAIEDSLESSTEESVADGVRLAFFVEEQRMEMERIGGGTPLSLPYDIAFVDNYFDFERTGESTVSDIERATMRLDDALGMKGYYQEIKPIDTTREYHFRFSYHDRIDVKSVFIIKNREFVCRELELEVTEKGMDPMIKGVFYPYG
ncbi:MAG: hypothetical protein LBI65_03665, partial [Candidatus Symbiothrix sp.]|nr:hypothetical protein [Candidatus Symbiothrix sp.]